MTVKVHDNRQVELAFPGPDVRDVRYPGMVRPIHSELTLQPIRCNDRWHADDIPRHLVAANRPDSMIPHDPSHSFPADAFPRFAKIQEHAGAPVDPAAGSVGLTDHLKQSFVFDRTAREGLVDPGIEAARGELQDPAHLPDREPITLRVDEGVLYSDSLAKYAALGSTSQRNTLIEAFCGRCKVQRLPRALVQLQSDPVQIGLGEW